MTPFAISTSLHTIGVKPKRAVVLGSASIAIRFGDFREPQDLDIVVSWKEFLHLLMTGKWRLVFPARKASWREIHLERENCEAFFCWKLGSLFVPYHNLVRESVEVEGVRVADLAWVKRYKRNLAREKDLRDLGFLRLHHA
jgi:hypothetical protein